MSVNECINMKYYIINDPQNLFTKLKINFIKGKRLSTSKLKIPGKYLLLALRP